MVAPVAVITADCPTQISVLEVLALMVGALFKNTARGQISGEKVGMLKLLFHVDTLEVLGVHCFGAEAAEIVHIGQAIMWQKGGGNTIQYFLSTTFNYPTMAEAYRVAALDGMNRVGRR